MTNPRYETSDILMRLWTVHPEFLDTKGLVALWREGLLAKAVLEGKTRGYQKHPQLIRFREQSNPTGALCEYLYGVLSEAQRRGYHFNPEKLPCRALDIEQIEESQGQLDYEWQHLLKKLSLRDPDRFGELSGAKHPVPHPLFTIVPGDIKPWEKKPV